MPISLPSASLVDARIASGCNVAGVTGEIALDCVTAVGDCTRAIERALATRAVSAADHGRRGRIARPRGGPSGCRISAPRGGRLVADRPRVVARADRADALVARAELAR